MICATLLHGLETSYSTGKLQLYFVVPSNTLLVEVLTSFVTDPDSPQTCAHLDDLFSSNANFLLIIEIVHLVYRIILILYQGDHRS